MMFNIVVGINTDLDQTHTLVGRGKPKDGAYAWEILTPEALKGLTSSPDYNNSRTACNTLARYFRQPFSRKRKQTTYYVPLREFSGMREAEKWCELVTRVGLPAEEAQKIKKDTERWKRKALLTTRPKKQKVS